MERPTLGMHWMLAMLLLAHGCSGDGDAMGAGEAADSPGAGDQAQPGDSAPQAPPSDSSATAGAGGQDPMAPANEPGDPAEPGGGQTVETQPIDTPESNAGVPAGSRIECAEPIATVPIAAPEPLGCVSEVGAGDHSIECGDVLYLLKVPERCTEFSCGLIVDVHGGTMNPAQMRLVTELDQLGPPCDYITLHPGENSPLVPGLEFTSQWNSGDDPKIREFIDDVMTAFSVDTERVHFTGFSLGGNMSWRFICNHGELFTSVAPIAATDDCADGGLDPEMDILYMHGHTDVVVSYGSGESMRDRVVAGLGMGAPEVIDQGDHYTRTRYTNDSGTVFDFLDHAFGGQFALDGHCVPGGKDLVSGPFSTTCSTPVPPEQQLHWGRTALDFFLESEGR